ncbi:B-type flagellar hook-associated protein 2 [Candidatus Magnetaquicoccaceae bacterium FCR-1]|uniref:Flagellar hook-associated protein 2 n=1 Tax=Candidatus Magnetaquiglobus chichijimensis TaxID=3141448 RepID=A0ABQ0C500_9PROT
MAGSFSITGLASGLPSDIVDQLVNAQKTRLKAMEKDKSFFSSQQTAIGELETKMLALETKSKELQATSAWAPHTVSSSDSDRVAATADSTAQAANHSVVVGQLATYDTKAMDAASGFAASTTTLGVGATFSFEYNGVTYGTSEGTTNFDTSTLENMTLEDLASAINGIDYGDDDGVSASVLYDGSKYRLILTAKDSGTYTDSFGNRGDRIDNIASGYGFTQTVTPQDAILKIDGIDVVSSTNQVTTALTGVTLNLQDVTTGTTVADSDGDGWPDSIGTSGTAVNISIQNDTTALKTVLTGFLDSYNAVVDYVNAHKTDTLSGDTLSRSVLSQMRTALNTQTQNSLGTLSPYSTLAEMGLRTDQKTGRISFDSSSLDKALATDFNSVTRLFTSKHTSTADGFNEGLAHRMADLIDSLTSSTGGSVTGRKDGLKARVDRLEKSIEQETSRLEKVRETLTKKFSNLEQMISKMNSQSSSLTSSISKLSGS